MPKYKIAGIVCTMNPQFSRLKNQAIPYLYNGSEDSIFDLSINENRYIQLENEYPMFSREDLEYIFMGQMFYSKILKHNGILLHSSCVVKDDYAYLFSAPSGTGKSTHTSLWLQYIDGTYILNDDKPAIMILEDGIYAAGTPFSGKVDLSRNELVKIKGICFIERSNDNWINKIDITEAINLILYQTERIPYEKAYDYILKHIEKIVLKVPVYKMGCNISKEACQLSYKKMKDYK